MPRFRMASRRELLLRSSAWLALGATAGALAVHPVRAAHEMSAHEQELYAAARKEGELTWYMSHSDDATAQRSSRLTKFV